MENKILNILVVDDTEQHRQAAAEQLRDKYQLHLASNYDEALKALLGMPPAERVGDAYDFLRAKERLLTAAPEEAAPPPFDVVLTDLLLPASRQMMGDEAIRTFSGLELAYGFPIALLALQRAVPYVAINTDANHHAHPMAFALETLGGMQRKACYPPIDSGMVEYNAVEYNNRQSLMDFGKSRLFITTSEQTQNSTGLRVKDWAKTLQHLLGDTTELCTHPEYKN